MPDNNNPWVVQSPKQYEPLASGAYMVKFGGVEDYQYQDEGKWRWKWEVSAGEHKGKWATALTNRSISPNTNAGRLIAGLLGREIVAGENVKEAIEGCVGKVYLAMVQPGPRGGKPQVQSVSKPPA